MSEKTTDNPHDTRLKELFGNKEAFMSFLHDCVEAKWADEIDADSLRQSPKSFILQDFKKKEADILYEAKLKSNSGKVLFYVLLENQSRLDYRMNYRLLLYITEILRDWYNRTDVNERKRRGFKFPAEVPIVFYTGREKWTAATNMKESFAGHEIQQNWDEAAGTIAIDIKKGYTPG
ncbi:MAG: Rpn family recombination-promoting nuclease/putative transposase [Oscillospiraceae bacterium]|nr:Rpn family recombination-promoting nuclease/putative transposase [Oscillospiraceae bacterium]